jgi:hypothetical protein
MPPITNYQNDIRLQIVGLIVSLERGYLVGIYIFVARSEQIEANKNRQIRDLRIRSLDYAQRRNKTNAGGMRTVLME